MEAVPRLPMISFELKVSPENVQFGPQIKQYIANFYNEDPESYNTEINNLESLRAAAIRPTIDVAGCQLLKKYYCQLHFLKSRFPMHEMEAAAVYFSWKDTYSNMPCSVPDIRFELMCILYNIGALHTQLGANDSRNNPDGLKMACTHFQCAAWAFQTVKETYYQMVPYMSSIEVVHFMQQVCFAQAQECILEKSMMDNRKATITAKVAVQVVDHYKRALTLLTSGDDESSFSNLVGSKTAKEWIKYLSFKVSYHKCIALLFQGQQAEEQQKMGERVAFYQAACEQLEEARKLSSNLKQQKEINEAIAFTSDVVEGKRKAAKNENEFIYHEEVPDKHALQEVKGASLVKGIAFNVNDVEVSGPDIFARLVPMEAHEASSLYSEKKAQKLRQLGEIVEAKDQALAEFMSSLQLDVFNQMRQATGLSQDLVDRAAALSAKPSATQDLVSAMGKLSNSYHEVESMLNEIQELLKEEEQSEKEYQELMGKRPPSIIATDLAREAAKYREAHNKANDSNQNLHKAMTTHVANLKILAQPLMELQQQIPSVELPNPNIDENCVKEIENLTAKVEEMRNQRAMLWTQFREAVHKDDITGVLVTRQPDQSLDQLFQQELQKHQELASLIEQNAAAQENILKAFVDAYARSNSTRRYLQDIISKRSATVTALITSFDTYEDLLAKANKGIDFYNKLETNVSKLLQRIKSASKVQQEEREQMLLKNSVPVSTNKDEILPATNSAPKLKDYIDTRKKAPRSHPEVAPQYYPAPATLPDGQVWPPAVRPAPLGSEVNNDPVLNKPQEPDIKTNYANTSYPSYDPSLRYDTNIGQSLMDKLSGLRSGLKQEPYYPQYSSYTPQNYATTSYNCPPPLPPDEPQASPVNKQAFTVTTDTYQPISSHTLDSQFPPTNTPEPSPYQNQQQYPSYPASYNAPSTTSLGSYSHGSQGSYAQISPGNFTQVTQSNVYYPSGYGPNATQITNDQTPSYPTSFGSSEYATSVHLGVSNINNYSSTYSAPVPNIKSSSSGATNYIISNGQNYQSFDNKSQQYPSGAYYYGPNYTQAESYSGVNLSQSGYSYAQPPTTSTETSYSQTAQSYPSGYSYAQQPSEETLLPTASYNQQTSEGAVPPIAKPPTGGYSYAQQASEGTIPPTGGYSYGQQSSEGTVPFTGAYGYVPQPPEAVSSSNAVNYPQTQTYPINYPSGYGYVQQPQSQLQPEPVVSVSTKESNIDLLTGLDFTVNQAPLIPQQNTSATDVKPVQKSETPKATKIVQNKEEAPSPPKIEKVINRKPLNNLEVQKLFGQEIDKFEKFVDVLTNKTLNGPTNLELKWKEILDKQEVEKKVISVARCYPMKNRYPDILPYDFSRVELKDAKDDYINASYVKDVSYFAAPFIVTQAPLPSTIGDFWTMIKEQQVELIACLLGDAEMNKEIYWPTEKGRDLTCGGMVISLMSATTKPHWIERLISINIPEKRDSRVVMHLQLTSWPGSLFPTNPEGFVTYITETVNLFLQQRNTSHPIVIHCSSGIGRSGLACLLISAILEVTNNAVSIPDLVCLSVKLAAWRKNMLRDREHLKFAYEAFLTYMKHVIAQGHAKKMLNEVVYTGQEDKKPTPVENKPEVNDPLSTLDPFWASKRGD